jgi:hypothetical protein
MRGSWPFFPLTSAPDKDKVAAQKSTGRTGTDSGEASPKPNQSLPPSPLPLVELDTNAAIALAFLIGSFTTLGASTVYRRFFKRIKSAEWITPDLLRRKRWITGIVTRCVLL